MTVTPMTIKGARAMMPPRGFPSLGRGSVDLTIFPPIETQVCCWATAVLWFSWRQDFLHFVLCVCEHRDVTTMKSRTKFGLSLWQTPRMSLLCHLASQSQRPSKLQNT